MVQEGWDKVSVETNELKKHETKKQTEEKKEEKKQTMMQRKKAMTRGVRRFQYMRTQRKTKTTKHTGGNLSERMFCKTVKFQKRGTRLVEFCLNSKMNIIFLHMCTLTRRRASGQEAGRALSQCWRSSLPRSICFNIIKPAREACRPEGPAR